MYKSQLQETGPHSVNILFSWDSLLQAFLQTVLLQAVMAATLCVHIPN